MLLLITGGSGSGKSEYAENRAVQLRQQAKGRLLYAAAMEPYDEESRRRIARHRNMRKDKDFTTIECYTHLEELATEPEDTILLECVSNLTANEMFSERGRGQAAAECILAGIRRLSREAANLVIVGNNVFEDGMEYDASTREYVRQMARIQNETAREADEVVEVVCGIPVRIKPEDKTNQKGRQQI